MRFIKSTSNSLHFSPIRMYRAKRTKKDDEKVRIYRRLRTAVIEKNIKVEINDKTYRFEVNGIATLNKQGEAIQLIIWIADGNVFRRNGKIEFSCKGHTIEKNKFVFGKVCGTEKYLETTGKMDIKKISYMNFKFRAVGEREPKPYPTINAEITFPCGSNYYLRISWHKNYEFTIYNGFEAPATCVS